MSADLQSLADQVKTLSIHDKLILAAECSVHPWERTGGLPAADGGRVEPGGGEGEAAGLTPAL